jgi:hypothetical protein
LKIGANVGEARRSIPVLDQFSSECAHQNGILVFMRTPPAANELGVLGSRGRDNTQENSYRSSVGFINGEEVGMGKTLFSLTFAIVLLALASSEASAFLYSSFVCQAVGARSVGWGRSFFIGEAKVIALSRCARRSGICTISYCVPGY